MSAKSDSSIVVCFGSALNLSSFLDFFSVFVYLLVCFLIVSQVHVAIHSVIFFCLVPNLALLVCK